MTALQIPMQVLALEVSAAHSQRIQLSTTSYSCNNCYVHGFNKPVIIIVRNNGTFYLLNFEFKINIFKKIPFKNYYKPQV